MRIYYDELPFEQTQQTHESTNARVTRLLLGVGLAASLSSISLVQTSSEVTALDRECHSELVNEGGMYVLHEVCTDTATGTGGVDNSVDTQTYGEGQQATSTFSWSNYYANKGCAAGAGVPEWAPQVESDTTKRIFQIINDCPDAVMLEMIQLPAADVDHTQEQVDALALLIWNKYTPTTLSATTMTTETSTTLQEVTSTVPVELIPPVTIIAEVPASTESGDDTTTATATEQTRVTVNTDVKPYKNDATVVANNTDKSKPNREKATELLVVLGAAFVTTLSLIINRLRHQQGTRQKPKTAAV